ncbi:glycoside hydrolase family 130 protein [bacterium]|nr:glycoside hydrolase family 130 protein [bacterium]
MPVPVRRTNIRFYPNPKRVITRFFMPGENHRAHSIIEKVRDLSKSEIDLVFNQALRKFSNRHRNITRIFERHFNNIKHMLDDLNIDPESLTREQRLIIGGFFTHEYSIESAAFFNPSIVEDPYQGYLQEGYKRIIASFRATGEGHISSLTFRSGIIDQNNDITFDPPGGFVGVPQIVTRHVYTKKTFLKKLSEMNIKKDVVGMVMDRLGDDFTYGALEYAIKETVKATELSYSRKKVIQTIQWLANSHYEVEFSLDTAISERVLFPISHSESNGIEDARFVKFTDDDGSVIYFATYTAYDGFAILPKLLSTEDFYHFKVRPIHGEHVQNKGLALFPRRINGQYAMLSRIDGFNNYIMFSDETRVWNNAKKILEPKFPWEYIQIGNAGSPIETKHGWLVITHGVGLMRTYCLGAVLLDLDDPTKVIARLKEPLLAPNEEERDGYVPNVVYSCGSIIHNNELIIPYAMSDYASTFARIPLDDLFREMMKGNRHFSKKNNRKKQPESDKK